MWKRRSICSGRWIAYQDAWERKHIEKWKQSHQSGHQLTGGEVKKKESNKLFIVVRNRYKLHIYIRFVSSMIAGIAERGDIPLLVSGIRLLNMTTIEATTKKRFATSRTFPILVTGKSESGKMFPKLEPWVKVLRLGRDFRRTYDIFDFHKIFKNRVYTMLTSFISQRGTLTSIPRNGWQMNAKMPNPRRYGASIAARWWVSVTQREPIRCQRRIHRFADYKICKVELCNDCHHRHQPSWHERQQGCFCLWQYSQ